MPATEISSLVTGIKGTIAVAKGLKSAYDAHTITQAQTEILEKLLSLQMDALSLQEDHFALIKEKDKLEQKLIQMENWEDTKRDYKLTKLSNGTFVRSPQNLERSGEPTHWLCENCFERKIKSILQPAGRFGQVQIHYKCGSCNSVFTMQISDDKR